MRGFRLLGTTADSPASLLDSVLPRGVGRQPRSRRTQRRDSFAWEAAHTDTPRVGIREQRGDAFEVRRNRIRNDVQIPAGADDAARVDGEAAE